MSDYCVVIASGGRARFFTLETADFPELESGPRLIDRGGLTNPGKETPERELFADSKTGGGRAPQGGPAHGYDDHREKHEDEMDRRFARSVFERIRRLATGCGARCVVVAAPSRMLGLLRQDLETLVKQGVALHTVAKDMTKFAPELVHQHLAKEGLLPGCRRPGV